MSKRSTNSQTAHSKQLRMKAAHEYDKRLREEGLIKNISLRLPIELFNEFDGLAQELSVNRVQCLRILLDKYHSSS